MQAPMSPWREAHWGLGLIWLQVAHEVQGLQHVLQLTFALLGRGSRSKEGAALCIGNLPPVTALQQGSADQRHLHKLD